MDGSDDSDSYLSNPLPNAALMQFLVTRLSAFAKKLEGIGSAAKAVKQNYEIQ
jgi:hypothetical protein